MEMMNPIYWKSFRKLLSKPDQNVPERLREVLNYLQESLRPLEELLEKLQRVKVWTRHCDDWTSDSDGELILTKFISQNESQTKKLKKHYKTQNLMATGLIISLNGRLLLAIFKLYHIFLKNCRIIPAGSKINEFIIKISFVKNYLKKLLI